MNLLPPQERISLQQKERERLVKEETDISKRVDALRELEQTEKKKLADFREREFDKFKREVEPLRQEKEELEGLIPQLREERRRLQEPVDLTKAWEEVAKGKEEIRIWNARLDTRESDQKEVSKGQKTYSAELDDRYEDVRKKEEAAERAFNESEKERKIAKGVLVRAESEKAEADRIITGRYDELSKKENENAVREHNLQTREAQVESDMNHITSQQIQLADQRATLQRTLARLSRKYGERITG
jgi:chromosome segregation ATPase